MLLITIEDLILNSTKTLIEKMSYDSQKLRTYIKDNPLLKRLDVFKIRSF